VREERQDPAHNGVIGDYVTWVAVGTAVARRSACSASWEEFAEFAARELLPHL